MAKKAISSILFMVTACLLLQAPLQGAIPAEERAALIAFYNATDGDNWTNNGGWKTPPLAADGFAMPGTEGRWKGILISQEYNGVTQISLPFNRLRGKIPIEIGKLGRLTILNLSLNSELTGQIPDELCYLNLINLDLSYCSFTGATRAIGNLNELIDLNLSYNYLLGLGLPIEALWELQNLKKLDLSVIISICVLPPGISKLQNLESLGLHYTNLNGSIPLELTQLQNLKFIDLSCNNLSGSIPAEFGLMEKLETLDLSRNRSLAGNIPPEIRNLQKLNKLDLSFCNLSGEIPNEIRYLSSLTYLYLNGNKFSGSIPFWLGELINLHHLDLSDNEFFGTIPDYLADLSNLTYFCVGANCVCLNRLCYNPIMWRWISLVVYDLSRGKKEDCGFDEINPYVVEPLPFEEVVPCERSANE